MSNTGLKKTLNHFSLVLLSVFCITSQTAFAKDLSADEVRELVSGNTIEAVNEQNGHKATTYFRPDGKFHKIRKKDGKRFKGTWSVNEKGSYALSVKNGARSAG